MVKKMNKTGFIKELSNLTGRSIDDCTVINSILEDNFFISRKSKDKIINELVSQLNIELDEADKIYNTAASILANQIKNKLKHPFKSVD